MDPHGAFINYVFLPGLIFLMRIADVSMGTIRIIFVSRGIKIFAAILGFFEVLIWLFAISQIMKNLNNPMHYVAYAAGFGMGNFVGISIEKWLSMGNRTVRIITKKDAADLIRALRAKGFGVTSIDGEGADGMVKLIFTVLRRNHVSDVVKLIKKFNPNAFYTVEDIRYVREDNIYPLRSDTGPFRRLLSSIYKKK